MPNMQGIEMARNKRIVVFLNEDEWNKIRACGPRDDGMSRVIRRLALRSADWMLRTPKRDGSLRQEEGTPIAWEPETSSFQQVSGPAPRDDGTWLDTSDSQL